ncbi:MAG: UDP-N-acetylmuramoyl-tripeptide--D-alanyl-D-alanine ligase [Deltaproteobacteria bacterium]|nr:UDP-N-acetylmuramoyl-tripeptide--D-alanyl-D-alanine ligase [Deltaproteobacteria bacterium]
MKICVSDLYKCFGEQGLSLPDDFCFAKVVHDSRAVTKDSLFLAVKGPRFDGHDFIKQARASGAKAILCEKRIDDQADQIVVPDVVQAMGQMASYLRERISKPVIAITGSSGKTTTKELLAHALSQVGKVNFTKGNLNNHLGVPLTVFDFDEDADFYIIEMGMSHFGEIEYLAKMVSPSHALVTNVGHAHIENLGGRLEGVAKAKGELFACLGEDAIAFSFDDDPFIRTMLTAAKRISYGFSGSCDFNACEVKVSEQGNEFCVCYGEEKVLIQQKLVGRHHVQNALVVYAICNTLGVDDENILSALKSFEIHFNRGRRLDFDGHVLVDDSYNANPDSMRAAVSALVESFPQRKKILVMGDMLELGDQAVTLHHEIGVFAKELGIDALYAKGEISKNAVLGFWKDDKEFLKTHWDSDAKGLAQKIIRQEWQQGTPLGLLVKGSRGSAMEKVIEALQAPERCG